MTQRHPPEIVVAGGGVAALEFVLALRALVGDVAHVTVVAPERDFVLRPLLVAAPLDPDIQWRWPLSEIAAGIGFRLVPARMASLDAERHRIILRGGDAIAYDSLVLALGARTLPVHDDAVHLGDAAGALGLQALHDQIRQGTVERVAFVVPSRVGWLLPVYEAALLTANTGSSVSASLVTPEERPLEAFGRHASVAVAEALLAAGVQFHGGETQLDPTTFDRIVTVPLIRGPELPGVPSTGLYGLIAVDDHNGGQGARKLPGRHLGPFVATWASMTPENA